jgi:hypothetical protein
MKRFAAVLFATVALVVVAAGTAMAITIGPPHIDPANATIAAKPSPAFKGTGCTGYAGVPYVTYQGGWSGSETEVPPGPTSYNLTGTWAVKKIVWTINLNTERGVLRGVATLTSQPASGGDAQVTYSGPITLITQGLPDSGQVQARGWIVGATYTTGKTDGGSLLANVEFLIGAGFSTTGEFGSSMGFNDLSVADNNLAC